MQRSCLSVLALVAMAMNPAVAHADCCAIVELRQYTLKPGQRETLIQLFDREFIESQEATGMTLVGQFRDRRRDDRFVWIRGFADMAVRHKALDTFYGGAVWAAHGKAANTTMVDVSDVLLLKPARPDSAFRLQVAADGPRPGDRAPLTVLAGIYQLPQPVDGPVLAEFDRRIAPVLRAEGIVIEGVFVTEYSRNTFSRLPVRENEHVVVWFGSVARDRLSPAALDQLRTRAVLNNQTMTLLDLEPTSRSRLGDGPNAARR
jgi:NIPSNAP